MPKTLDKRLVARGKLLAPAAGVKPVEIASGKLLAPVAGLKLVEIEVTPGTLVRFEPGCPELVPEMNPVETGVVLPPRFLFGPRSAC